MNSVAVRRSSWSSDGSCINLIQRGLVRLQDTSAALAVDAAHIPARRAQINSESAA
jgi:hypothetical protein